MIQSDLAQSRYAFFEIISRSYSTVLHRCRHTGSNEIFIAKHWVDDEVPDNKISTREFELLSKLNIEGIVKPIELWENAGIQYLIVDNFQGLSLEQHIAKKPLAVDEALAIAIEITRTVDQMHSNLVAHNNISPSNIIWNPDTDSIKLIDFDNATQIDAISGRFISTNDLRRRMTLDYMPPEHTDHVRLTPDYRSDLYSIGATVYTLLTGSPPFVEESGRAIMHAHMATPPTPPTNLDSPIPADLSQVVLKLLAKRPIERYQSAYGALQDLLACEKRLNKSTNKTPVPLATKDYSPFLDFDGAHITARPTESNLLLNRFKSRVNDALHVVLLLGPAGIGKTATVDTFIHQSTSYQRCILRGKCEQLSPRQPYSVWVQAIDDFVHTIIAQGDDSKEKWGQILTEQLSSKLSIITDLAPALKLITGNTPTSVALAPAESKQRFFSAFVEFIHCISTRLPNTVLFLDDLHWADTDSIDLFCHLYASTPRASLLLIGTMRPDEIDQADLHRLIDSTKTESVKIDAIELLPFTLDNVGQHLANLLSAQFNDVSELAAAVLQKTAGNPWFVNHFIFELARNKCLYFDHTVRHWQWDIEAVLSMGATDNVVNILTDRLKALTQEELQVLSISACIGHSFTDEQLSAVLLNQTSKINNVLANLQNEQLIQKISPDSEATIDIVDHDAAANNDTRFMMATLTSTQYKFEHDRIWQAAYEHLPVKERQRWHKLIGQSILANHVSGPATFAATDHLNLSDVSLMSLELQFRVCQLNLDGARDARKNSAFELAKSRFNFGLVALPDDSWLTLYDLSRDLHLEYAELCSSTGDHENATLTLEKTEGKLTSVVDRGRATYITVVRHTLNELYADAISVGIEGLHELGVHAPVDNLRTEVDAIINDLQNYDLSLLLSDRNKPRLTADPELAVIMAILMQLLPPSETHDSVLNDWIAVKMAQLSLTRGLTPQSAKGLANFGTALALQGDYATGYKFGKLALSLIRQPEFAALSPRVLFNFLTYVNHWRDSFSSSRALAEEAIDSCQEYGDVQYRGYVHALNNCMNEIFVLGKSQEQVALYSNYLKLANESGNGIASGILTAALIWLANLQGKTINTEAFNLGDLTGSDHVKHMQNQGNYIGVAFYHVLQAFSNCLYCRNSDARLDLAVVYELESYLSTTFSKAIVVFVRFMANVSELPSANTLCEIPDQASASLLEDLQQMQFWSEQCEENFAGLSCLMEAEYYRIQGRVDKVIQQYDRAIQLAETNNRLLFAAFSNERAARFWTELGKDNFAREYFTRALATYRAHGAQAKHDQLSSELTQLLVGRQPTNETTQPLPMRTSVGSPGDGELNYRALLDASSSIASELRLLPLIALLLRTVMQNTGARRAALFLIENTMLSQFADFHGDREDLTKDGAPPLADHFPLNLLNYVVTIQDSAVVDDLEGDHIFKSDNYFKDKRRGALACVPIKHQGITTAIVYLENDLIPGIFDEEKMQILQVLVGCAATSLRNSLLYRSVEKKVEERTREVTFLNATLEKRVENQVDEIARLYQLKQFVSSSVAELIMSAGENRILASHRRELSIVFCDLRGFTGFSECVSANQAVDVLREYHAELGKLIEKYNGTIDHRAGDGIMVFFNDPIPTDDYVESAIRLAKDMRERVNIMRQSWRKLGSDVGFGIGIAVGQSTVGLVGHQGRFDYSATGRGVNLASRLCDMALDGQILIDHDSASKSLFIDEAVPLGAFTIDGFTEPLRVCTL